MGSRQLKEWSILFASLAIGHCAEPPGGAKRTEPPRDSRKNIGNQTQDQEAGTAKSPAGESGISTQQHDTDSGTNDGGGSLPQPSGTPTPNSPTSTPTATTRTPTTPTPTPTTVATNTPVVDSVASGLAVLKNASEATRSYQYKMVQYGLPIAQSSGLLDKAPSTSSEKSYFVNYWERMTKNCSYSLQAEHNGKYSDYVYAECLPANDFGVVNCPSPLAVTFLGVKDIGSFKKAWGVSFTCTGTVSTAMADVSQYAGRAYLSRHEIWFHPESHHYRHKVAEAYVTAIQNSLTESFESMMRTRTNEPAYAIHYDNYTAQLPKQKTYDIWASYQVTGALKLPGSYAGPAACYSSDAGATKIDTILINSLMFASGPNPAVLYYVFGFWESSLPPEAFGGSVRSVADHSNRHPRKPGELLNGISVSYTKMTDAPFYKVVPNNPFQLNQGLTRYGYGWTTVNGMESFYCFASPDGSPGRLYRFNSPL